MYKNISARWTGLLLLALSVISCETFVDIDPENAIDKEKFYRKEADIDNAARGMYDGLQGAVEQFFVWGEVRGDGVIPADGANHFVQELEQFQVKDNNPFTDWSPLYDVINRANHIIKYAPQVQEADFQFTPEEQAQFDAEAKNVRALCYFYLVRTFGDVPLILEPYEDISVKPLYDPVDQEVILDTIMKDLKTVEGIERTFPQEVVDGNANSRVYASRVKAITNLCLQADIHLWRNEYPEAKEACEKAIALDPERYSIGTWEDDNVCYVTKRAPSDTWYKIFGGNQNLAPETIFELQFHYSTPDVNVLQRYTSKKSLEGGQYIVKPTQKIVDLFEGQSYGGRATDGTVKSWWGDVHRGYNVAYTGTYNKNTHRLTGDAEIFKYICSGPNGARREEFASEANWIIYRMGELYLMYAEALNRLGMAKEALLILDGDQTQGLASWTDFNSPGVEDTPMGVRKRVLLKRHVNPESAELPSMEEIEDWIYKERALELAFEGKRWYDLVRLAKRGRQEVLINNVVAGTSEENRSSVRTALSNQANWYLPYNSDAKKFFSNK